MRYKGNCKKRLLVRFTVFFISRLGLEGLLGRLNQQSSQNKKAYKKFFIFNLVSIHLGAQGLIRHFTPGQHPSQSIRIFFGKNVRNVFSVIFSYIMFGPEKSTRLLYYLCGDWKSAIQSLLHCSKDQLALPLVLSDLVPLELDP